MTITALRNRLGVAGEDLTLALQTEIAIARRSLMPEIVPTSWSLCLKIHPANRPYSEESLFSLGMKTKNPAPDNAFWLPAMMNDLERNSIQNYTSPLAWEEIRGYVRETDGSKGCPGKDGETCDFGKMRQEVLRASSLSALSLEAQNWLADSPCGPHIAPFYGGIKLPYESTRFLRGAQYRPLREEPGEIMLAIISDNEELDGVHNLQFALYLAEVLQKFFDGYTGIFLEIDRQTINDLKDRLKIILDSHR